MMAQRKDMMRIIRQDVGFSAKLGFGAVAAGEAKPSEPVLATIAAEADQSRALAPSPGLSVAPQEERDDAVPFGVHHAVAVLVALNPPLEQARVRGGQGEVGDLGAALRGADVGVLTDVADEDDDVLHLKLLYLAEGTIPSTRPE